MGADMMRRWAIVIALGGLAVSAFAADAPFPNRPVRMLIPYPAGGGLDLPGRAVAQKFVESTGEQMVIDNRGGAGGLIAGEIVAKATPDGYTLFLASNGQISIAPALYPKLPYDPLKDFVPITHFVDTPMVLFVNAQYPVQSVADLIAAAKAKPGTIGCALSGVGGVSHLTLELFKLRANVNPAAGAVPWRCNRACGCRRRYGTGDLLYARGGEAAARRWTHKSPRRRFGETHGRTAESAHVRRTRLYRHGCAAVDRHDGAEGHACQRDRQARCGIQKSARRTRCARAPRDAKRGRRRHRHA
jgi:hypothetical protein